MKERQKKLHLQYAKKCTEKETYVQNFHNIFHDVPLCMSLHIQINYMG